MRTPAPADSLRVARALLRQSQRAVAKAAGISQKTLGELENGEASLIEKNLQLVDFYVSQGIELVGDTQIGKAVSNAGAKWSAPFGPDATDVQKSKFRAEGQPTNFGAARALVKKSQAFVAAALEVSTATVQNLENSDISSPISEKLKHWYEEQGVVFTGWGDVATGRYYGIGVRWASPDSRVVADRSVVDGSLADR
ncbi:helix-turn-helix transcriptional regulator [Rhizobium leguminosarum]|uniref:helix-turn-helix transcriptional regulator n=1 Tax=Rhizobium leguminosarum TaxID=384 RepID=UPI002FF11744